MKAFAVLLLIGLLGCGGNPRRSLTVSLNASPLSVSGFVSTVQLTSAATNLGGNSPVTVVTFLPQLPQNGPTTILTFCGNVVSDFALNTFATVAFSPGVGCAKVVSLSPMTFVSISGFVSIIQLTTLGNNSPVTMVTFLLPVSQNGLGETFAFCGNVGSQFALNTFMTVSFTQGAGCSTLVSVIA